MIDSDECIYLSVDDGIGIPTCTHLTFCQGVDPFHILRAKLKVKDLEVLYYSSFVGRFGKNDEVVLVSPSKANLSNSFFVLVCQILHEFVIEQLLVVSSQRRVGFDGNIVLPTKINSFPLPQQRMNLKLVYCWLDIRVGN